MNRTSSNIKDIVNKISDEFGLDNDWLNDDFKKTTSYTPKLVEHSKFYKRFYNCLDVRTVSDEYVVAMKLCSGRDYKYDLSDVVGIIMEHSESQKELKRESIEKAYHELYNQELPEKAIVHGYVMNFRKDFLPVKLSVLNKNAMAYFEDLEASERKQVFTRVRGNEVSTITVKRVEEEGAFGETFVREYPNSHKDYVINWAKKDPYEIGEDCDISAYLLALVNPPYFAT